MKLGRNLKPDRLVACDEQVIIKSKSSASSTRKTKPKRRKVGIGIRYRLMENSAVLKSPPKYFTQ